MNRIFLFLLLTTFTLFGQQNNKKIDLTHGTIAEKFDRLYQKSGKYKQYKVVEHQLILQLKNQVLDSLNKERKLIHTHINTITDLQSRIDKLEADLKISREQIKQLSEEKDTISFMSAAVEKSQYKMIMWLLVSVLLLALLYFIYAFKNSNKETKTAKNNLEKLEEEYNNFRTMSLEREQLLKRQLLDEQKKHQA